MAVRVPVSADNTQAVNAVEQIRTALRRAGQEGKAFSDIDLSHPELQSLAAQIRKVQENFEDLAKVGRGSVAAAVRSMVGTGGAGSFSLDAWLQETQRRFADPNERQRHVANVSRYVLQGTNLNPPSPPPGQPSPPPPPGPSPAPFMGGAGGSMMNMAKAAGGFFLAQAGIQKIAEMAARAVSQAEQEATATDTLMRHIRDTSVDFFQLRDSVRQASEGLRLTYAETNRLTQAWSRLTGEDRADSNLYQVRNAAGFARSYGIDPGQAVQTMARLQALGGDPKNLAMLIGDAVNNGQMKGQVEQVMGSLLRWSETASRLIVTQTNVGDYAAMYAGMNASMLPGLRGSNADALIGQLDSSVRQGGSAGSASMALTYRALARHGVTDPYQIQYMLAGGMFEHVGGEHGSTMFDVMRSEVNDTYAGLPYYQRLHAMSQMFGINMRQAEALDKFKPGALGATHDLLAKSGVDMTKLNPTALADISDVANSDNGPQLEAIRKRMMGRGDLSDAELSALGGSSGDALKETMVRILGVHGQEQTEGTHVDEANAKFANALTAAGSGLVPVISDLKMATGSLVAQIGRLSTVLGDVYAKSIQNRWDYNQGGYDNGNGTQTYITPDGFGVTVPNTGGAGAAAGTGTGAGTRVTLPSGSGSAGMRANNPLNLMYANQDDATGFAELSGGRKLAVFPDMATGEAAEISQLQKYQREGYTTVRQMATHWVGDPNADMRTYIGDLARELGVGPDDPIDMNDPRVAAAWLRAGAPHESGRLSEEQIAAGVSKAFPSYHPAPGGAGGASRGGGAAVHVDGPLRVIHERPDGSQIGEQFLPFTVVPAPQPLGVPPT